MYKLTSMYLPTTSASNETCQEVLGDDLNVLDFTWMVERYACSAKYNI